MLSGDSVVRHTFNDWKNAVGIAGHDISKGDVIEWSPMHSTDDILLSVVIPAPSNIVNLT
jgi:hypothetical protein